MKIASVLVLAVVTSSFCPLKAQNPLPSPTPATSALSSNQSLITNQDVIALLKAGLSAEIVAAKIKNSRCQCDTSPAGLEQLKTAAVPDNVIMAMVESSVPATPTQPSGLNDIREARTVYLVNDTTDMKVFNGFSEKLHEWGRWRVVERPEDADLLLIFSGSNRYVGSMSTANVNASATYASGSGMTIPIVSAQRFLIAVDRASKRQLLAVDCERRMSASYTTGVLVNRMRKQLEKMEPDRHGH